jgi:hypothetical protein
MITRFSGFAAILLVAITSALPANANVLFSNFNVGDTYQTGTANSWAIGNGINNNGFGSSNAVSFVTDTFSFHLDSVEAAFNYFSGSNDLILEVAQDNGSGLPGTVLAQQTFTNAVPQFSSAIITWTPTNVSLAANAQYWIIATTTDLQNNVLGWQWNSIGENGYAASFNNGAWGAQRGVTPVLRVNGTILAPEPESLLLFPSLIPVFLLARRRKTNAA